MTPDPRPVYHHHPRAGWINDPVGLVHWRGRYHLFHALNQDEVDWVSDNGVWGHAVSDDLCRWTELPVALAPTPGGADEDGCWSGSTVIADGRPTLVYTGVRDAHLGAGQRRESVCVAYADDTLSTFTKASGNPVVAGPPAGLDTLGFRDPFVWRDGETWSMIVGTGLRGAGGAVLRFRSRDLLQWEYEGVMHTRSPDLVDPWTARFWECPAFLDFGEKQMLLVSIYDPEEHGTSGTAYVLGTDGDGEFAAEHTAVFDHGPDYFAPAVMRDDEGRRLVFGWSPEARTPASYKAAGWAGVVTLPRELTLDAGGLRIEPVAELASLRDGAPRVFAGTLDPAAEPMAFEQAGAQLEVELVCRPRAHARFALALRRAPDGSEETTVRVDTGAGTIVFDRTRTSLDADALDGTFEAPLRAAADEPLRIRVFLDASIVELYANGRTTMTQRIYPSLEESLDLALAVEEGELEVERLSVWRLRP